MHARKVFLSLTIIFSMLSGAFAQEDKIARSVSWLEGQQNADGSWSQGSRQLIDTVEVFKAFSSLNQGVTALNKALNYIAGVPETDNDKLARKLLALNGSTATIAGQLSKLASLQNTDGGWGLGEKKQSNITDTILVLDALASAQNVDPQIFARGRDYLIAQQKSDGSWGAAEENAPSDVCRTSQILCTLTAVRQAGNSSSSLEQAISKAQSFIEGKNSSGSYGSLVDTALAYLALAKLKQPAELQSTLTNLTSAQAADGSWENNIYTTAVVLQALGAIQPPDEPDLPDLEVTESAISFLPEAPFAGNQVTLKATVFNKGEIAAENVTVEFFNRDPRVGGTAIGAVQTISSIPADGSAQVQAVFDTAGLIGVQQIVVFVDRVNQIRESSEANNAAAKLLTVGGVPDLKIATEDIQFSKQSPQAFEVINIVATVKNIGNTAAENVTVRFLDNNAVVTEMFLGSLGAGRQSTATLSTGLPEGQHNITVKVDPEKLVTGELITSNNEATASIIVSPIPPGQPDLKIENVTFNPAAPLANQAALVKITVSNSGGQAVTTPFQVQIKDGATVLNTFDISSLASGQQAVLNLNTTFAAGSHAITVTADPGNVVAESDKSNNSALRNLTVQSSATPVELGISSLSVTPPNANVGDSVQISGTVYNSGTTSATNVIVRLFDGTQQAGHDTTINVLTAGQNVIVQYNYVLSTDGQHALKLVVDPASQIAEGNETNNEASSTVTAATVPRADLQLAADGISFSKTSPLPGETFQITVNMSNIGTADSAPSKLLITKGNPLISGAILIGELDVPSVAAGMAATLQCDCILPDGNYDIYVFADSRQTIAELSESNNMASKSTSTQALPDLAVDASFITFSHTNLEQGGTVQINVVVSNTGSVKSSQVSGKLLTNTASGASLAIATLKIPELEAGGSIELKALWQPMPGQQNVVLNIDTDNILRENSKENNSAVKAVNITGPESVLHVLARNADAGYYQNSVFSAYQTVYFEIIHAFAKARVTGNITTPDGKLLTVAPQSAFFSFNVTSNKPGIYTAAFQIVNAATGVVLDKVSGTFEIKPTKKVAKVAAAVRPSRVTVLTEADLAIGAELTNNSNVEISGTVNFSYADNEGTKIIEENLPFNIMPDKLFHKISLPAVKYTFNKTGTYVLTVTVAMDGEVVAANPCSALVLEAASAGIEPSSLQITLPFNVKQTQSVKIVRGGTVPGEYFDVMFLFDISGSFWNDIGAFQSQAASIASAIKTELGDVRFGMATFSDYPYEPFGEWDCGDKAFMLNRALTNNEHDVLNALNSIQILNGDDTAEAQLEALYQTITGAGKDLNGNGNYNDRGDIPPANIGWREGSTRIIFFATDAPFHRPGDGGVISYPGPSFAETIKALNDHNAIVVGLLPYDDWGGEADTRQILDGIHSVDVNGKPLIFHYGTSGTEIAQTIMQALTDATNIKISMRAAGDEKNFFQQASPDSVHADANSTSAFDLLFNGMVPQGIEAQTYDFEMDVIGNDTRIIGRLPVSVIVPAKIPLTVKTDKEQYLDSEAGKVKVDLALGGNTIKGFASENDWKSGVLEHLSATLVPGKLTIAEETLFSPENLIHNGDFETGNTDNWTFSGNIWLDGEEPFSGAYSASIWASHWGGPSSSYMYQELTLPENTVSAILSCSDFSRYNYGSYKIEIWDSSNNLLKSLLNNTENSWNVTPRNFDIIEFAGKTIRICFSESQEGGVYIDNVKLDVVRRNYFPEGSAAYVIDAGMPVIWDKVIFDAKTPEGTSVSIKTRGAASLSELPNSVFSDPVIQGETSIQHTVSRYLEVRVEMSSVNAARTPALEILKITYAKYSPEDNMRLKVFLQDANGAMVRQLAEVVPVIELGKQQTYEYGFNTGNTAPGQYSAVGKLYVNEKLEARDADSYEIIGAAIAAVLDGGISTEKLEYTSGESVSIISKVKNSSENINLGNIGVLVEVQDSSGNVLKNYNYKISNLLQKSLNQNNLLFSTDAVVPGTYKVIQKVSREGSEVFTRQTTFNIIASVEAGKGIAGSVTPDTALVKRRSGRLGFGISAKNTGNVDLPGVVLKTRIFDPATLQEIRTFSSSTDLMLSSAAFAGPLSYGAVELAPGSYPVTLTAELAYKGQSISIPLDVNGFTVTNDPPVANAGADQKIEGTSVDGMSVVLSGSGSTDGNSTNPPQMNDDIVSYEWSEGATVLGTGPTLTHTFPWGVHTVKLTVKDTLGATGADEVVVNIGDTTAPVISEQTPPHNQISTLATPVFNARLSDSCSGIKASSIVLTVDGAAVVVNYNSTTGAMTANSATLTDGWHNVVLKVSDNAGNQATSAEWKIGVDTKGPNITDIGPVNNTITTNPASVLSVRAVDAFSLVNATSITLTLDGTALAANYDAASGMITATPATALADGWHNAALRVKDNAGNESVSPEWKIGVDTTPPQITEMMPVSNIITANSKPALSVKVSDSFSGIKANSIVLTVDGAALAANYDAASGMITAAPVTALSDGWHNVVLKVSDIAGNQATSAEWKIGVDTTPPQITGMTPASGSSGGNIPEISAVVTDSFSGINSGTIQLSVNSTVIAHTYDAQTGKVTVSSPVLQSGGNSIVLTVKDMAGNQKTSDTWTITVQSQQPKDYLLFHNSSGGTLSITGSGKTVNGKAHSNADIKVSGSGNTISGQTTAVGSIKITGSGNNIPNKQSGAAAQPIPVYSLSYYQQHATYTHSGTWHISGSGEQIPAGIHFVNGDVKISGSNVSGNVTIVATGYIRISGSNITLSSSDARDSMLLFSMNDIQLSGSGDTLSGIIYAPAGECSLSGSGKNIRGAVIGSKAGITGSNITISPLN